MPRAPKTSRAEFPPIGEYGFLSDCHTGALVAPDGAIEWLCLPRFDSPSLFGAILDRDAGSFRYAPPGVAAPASRRYVPGTNVIETTWMTPTGWVVIHDALAIGEWREHEHDRHKRPPADHEAEAILIRFAECTHGEVDLELACTPRPDYGRRQATWKTTSKHRVLCKGALEGGLKLALGGDIAFDVDGDTVRGSKHLKAGQTSYCALGWGKRPRLPRSPRGAMGRLGTTGDFWRIWLANGSFPDHPWRSYLQRSALVLKGLNYAPTGSFIAALTTSLPETPGGERNWDYRYSWIRDSTFALWALHTLGLDEEAFGFIDFFAEVCGTDPDIQIMYGIDGEAELTETTLDNLSGYGGAKPVRIGNGAFDQRQNDVYGALLDSVYIHSKALGKLPDDLWALLETQVEAAMDAWEKPDQGIWEARGDPKHYVSSKLMCWVALDRGARLAAARDEAEKAERWRRVADEIKAQILDRGVDERGVFRQHYDTDALDASNLLIPLVRFLPPDDERVRATVLAIADELSAHGLVLRYKVDETDDGLSGKEGTFTICSFWLVSALSEIGEPQRARNLCERLLSMAGTLELYAEEIDSDSGRHLGNFPQAFTHLGLINAVSHVIADEQRDPAQERTAVFSEML